MLGSWFTHHQKKKLIFRMFPNVSHGGERTTLTMTIHYSVYPHTQSIGNVNVNVNLNQYLNYHSQR